MKLTPTACIIVDVRVHPPGRKWNGRAVVKKKGGAAEGRGAAGGGVGLSSVVIQWCMWCAGAVVPGDRRWPVAAVRPQQQQTRQKCARRMNGVGGGGGGCAVGPADHPGTIWHRRKSCHRIGSAGRFGAQRAFFRPGATFTFRLRSRSERAVCVRRFARLDRDGDVELDVYRATERPPRVRTPSTVRRCGTAPAPPSFSTDSAA